ncbi:MAG: hypothetical protein AAGA09_00790 [Pseudomonadota bacterium]
MIFSKKSVAVALGLFWAPSLATAAPAQLCTKRLEPKNLSIEVFKGDLRAFERGGVDEAGDNPGGDAPSISEGADAPALLAYINGLEDRWATPRDVWSQKALGVALFNTAREKCQIFIDKDQLYVLIDAQSGFLARRLFTEEKRAISIILSPAQEEPAE